MHKNYCYTSIFADFVNNYINVRREAGFMFDNPAYWLFRFDQFCEERQVDKAEITKDLYDSWAAKQSNELLFSILHAPNLFYFKQIKRRY